MFECSKPSRCWPTILYKTLILFVLGGFLYCGIEMLFRGRTHFSMWILGGLCFIIIGSLNERFEWEMPLISQMFISMCVITILEFIFGLVLNVLLHLSVWDYSNMPYNLLGQICLLFSVCWFWLSLPAIVIDDMLRFILYQEEVPRYSMFCAKAPVYLWENRPRDRTTTRKISNGVDVNDDE